MAEVLIFPHRRVLRERHVDETLYAPMGFVAAPGMELDGVHLQCDAQSPYPVLDVPVEVMGHVSWNRLTVSRLATPPAGRP